MSSDELEDGHPECIYTPPVGATTTTSFTATYVLFHLHDSLRGPWPLRISPHTLFWRGGMQIFVKMIALEAVVTTHQEVSSNIRFGHPVSDPNGSVIVDPFGIRTRAVGGRSHPFRLQH